MSALFPTSTSSSTSSDSSSSSSSSSSSLEFASSSSNKKEPSYILIYDKLGVNETCRTATYQQIHDLVDDRLYRVEYYSQAPHAIEDTRSNPVSLFVIPGGDFTQMNDELKPLVTKIQDLVMKVGVGYLGICAGAIAAAQNVLNAFAIDNNYSTGFPINMYDWSFGFEKANLNLYSENCATWTPTSYLTSYSAPTVYQPGLGTRSKMFNVYFKQGVFFPRDREDTRTLLAYTGLFNGIYLSSENKFKSAYNTEQPAAAIAEKVGEGYIVLSGVHPEIGAEIVNQFKVTNANQEALKSKVFQQLQPYKDDQTDLMRLYLDTLTIATKK